MVQRLVSSMRPTKYVSAAFCRHKMACPWKCMSYLTTSRAISWTNCKKGSFQMRSSVLFWNWQISSRATVPGQYFWVFMTFPAFKNSFLGVLPPTVGWSFFLASSTHPTQMAWPLQPSGPAVGLAMTEVTPTFLSCSAPAFCFSISLGSGGVPGAGNGGEMVMGVPGLWYILGPSSWPPSSSTLSFSSSPPPSYPLPYGVLSSSLPCWNLGRGRINQLKCIMVSRELCSIYFEFLISMMSLPRDLPSFFMFQVIYPFLSIFYRPSWQKSWGDTSELWRGKMRNLEGSWSQR